MKKCTYCNEHEIGFFFNKNADNYSWLLRNGKTCGSKNCKKEYMRAYASVYNLIPEKKNLRINAVKRHMKTEKYKETRKRYRKRKEVVQREKESRKIRAMKPESKEKNRISCLKRYKALGSNYRKKETWDFLYKRQKGVDPICGLKIPNWKNRSSEFHVDHIFPFVLSKDKIRTNDLNNLQIICSSCNHRKKGNKSYLEKETGQWRLSI